MYGKYDRYEMTRQLVEAALKDLNVQFTVNDRRNAFVSELYLYNYYIVVDDQQYSILIGDFGAFTDEKIIEVYPFNDDVSRFSVEHVKLFIKTLITDGHVAAEMLVNSL